MSNKKGRTQGVECSQKRSLGKSVAGIIKISSPDVYTCASHKKPAETGPLLYRYGLMVYKNGAPKTTVIKKHIWEHAKVQFGEIDREGEEFMKRTMDKFKNL